MNILSRDEPSGFRRNPIFYQLDLNPDKANENLIIDLIYDDLAPIRLNDMRRGTDMPHGVRFWTQAWRSRWWGQSQVGGCEVWLFNLKHRR